MIRKVVLVGARSGAEIASRNMKKPRAIVTGKSGTIVEVSTHNNGEEPQRVLVTVPGRVDLPCALWTSASVVEGDHKSVLCIIED